MRLSHLEVGLRKLSNETSELISFGGGEYFVASKQDCLVWGWRIFCSETSEIVSYGVRENFLTRQASSSRLEVENILKRASEIVSYGGGAGTHSIQSS